MRSLDLGQARSIVEELVPLNDLLWTLNKTFLIENFWKIVKETMSVAPTVSGPMVVVVCGFLLLNMLADPFLQATFGIFNSWMLIFFYHP